MSAGRQQRRDYPRLWAELCDCNGPQPSLDKPLADLHAEDCPYRREVEGDGQDLP